MLEEKDKNTVQEEKETKNYGDLLKTGGVSMKDIISDKSSAFSKLEAINKEMYEIIDLPSRGWTYPEKSVLATGRKKLKFLQVEIRLYSALKI